MVDRQRVSIFGQLLASSSFLLASPLWASLRITVKSFWNEPRDARSDVLCVVSSSNFLHSGHRMSVKRRENVRLFAGQAWKNA